MTNTIPKYLSESTCYGEWYQAMANYIERTSDEPIEWTESGPMCNGISLSYQFMYPPIFNIDKEIERLNDPSQDPCKIHIPKLDIIDR